LTERGIDLADPWRELSTVRARADQDHRFIWQQGGPETYENLLGRYLDQPLWLVRFARFEGDVAERAEEYRVLVGSGGTVLRFTHQLPEGRPGAMLEEEEARAMAYSVLRTIHETDPEGLREISSEPEKLPERRDWRLVFASPDDLTLEEGEARIAVNISGDEVSDTYRFVHVPEDWERQERNRSSTARLVRILCMVVTVLIFVAGGVTAIVRWSRGRFAVGVFARFLGLLAILGLVELFNSWPTISVQFSTAQPFTLQAAVTLGGALVFVLVTASVVALIIGLVHQWLPAKEKEGLRRIKRANSFYLNSKRKGLERSLP
jgi:hypothetical protein